MGVYISITQKMFSVKMNAKNIDDDYPFLLMCFNNHAALRVKFKVTANIQNYYESSLTGGTL